MGCPFVSKNIPHPPVTAIHVDCKYNKFSTGKSCDDSITVVTLFSVFIEIKFNLAFV